MKLVVMQRLNRTRGAMLNGLRKATESLRENWGEHMTECNFNWRIMKTIFTELHIYDEEKNYIPMDSKKPEKFFSVQRKYLPNGM